MPQPKPRRIMRRSDWDEIVAVFALVIGFTYSDEIVEFVTDVNGASYADWRWLVAVIDVVLVAATAWLKWDMTPLPKAARPFVRRMLTGRWGLGAAIVIGLHLVLLALPEVPGQRWVVLDSPFLTLLASAIFVAAMGLLLVSALGGGRETSSSWIVPVIIGTMVAQCSSVMWLPLIDGGDGCANDISTDFFNAMVQVVPVFLVTLGLEVNYLRGAKNALEPGQRAVPVMTVVLLCIAEALTLSVLVKADDHNCGVGAVWHEYVAFILNVHAASIGLATLAWLLMASPGDD